MKNFWTYIWIIGSVFTVTSCSDNKEILSSGTPQKGLRITTSLHNLSSRAAGGEIMSNDNGGFTEGDQIGLFSEGGNPEENSDGKLTNIPLTFESASGEADEDGNEKYYTFTNDEIEVNTGSVGDTYVYYPYLEKIHTEDGASIVDNNGRAFDFLTASGEYGKGYAFRHAFCRLKITCGEGFDNVTSDQKIIVYLNRGADKIRIIDNTDPENKNSFKTYELFGEKKDFETWSEKDWEGKETWNVILPCLDFWKNTTKVDYITIYDNEGIEHKLHLPHDVFEIMNDQGEFEHEPDGYLKKNQVFHITIQKENLVPTIRRGEITPWDEDTPITIERGYGIYENQDFLNCITLYNAFIEKYNTIESRPSKEEIEREDHAFHSLLIYGTYMNKRWNFYLGCNLDLSDLSKQSLSACITHLCDTLSGGNHILGNLSLESDAENAGTAVVGILSGEGYIQDLALSSVRINNNAPSGGLSGTLVADMQGGAVANCTVTGISMRCKSSVLTGAFAGRMTEGTVEYCTFQGAMIGGQTLTGTYEKILGKGPDDDSKVTITHVNATNVIFTTNN